MNLRWLTHKVCLILLLLFITGCGFGGGGGGGHGVPIEDEVVPPGETEDITVNLNWNPTRRPIAGVRIWFGKAVDFGDMYVLTVLNSVDGVAPFKTSFNLRIDLLSVPGDTVCFKVERWELDGTFGPQSIGVCAPAISGTVALPDCWESLFATDVTGRCRRGEMGALAA